MLTSGSPASLRADTDVIVVGAGSAGSAAAARLAAAGRRVLLLEQGPAAAAQELLADPDRLPSAGEPLVQRAAVRSGVAGAELLRGRVLGGSSAVNGAYFVRPTDADLHRWAAVGGAPWSPERWHDVLCRLERDAELGSSSTHGSSGPVTVTRHAAPLHPVTEAFLAAADALGHPEQADLNGGGAPGWGPVPRNIDPHGRRCSAATAYLAPLLAPGTEHGLTVRTGAVVRRVLVDGERAVGVEVLAGDGTVDRLHAHEVVLAAGAFATPVLLAASGIGPERLLARRGTDVVVAVEALGARGASHVAVDLRYVPTARPGGAAPLLQGALHLDTDAGPAEVLATCRPYGVATGDDPTDVVLSLRVSGMWPRPLALVADPDHPELHAVAHGVADVGLREAVRRTVELVRRPELAAHVAEWLGPDPATLRDDAELDRWIDAHLTWSHHLCSTAPIGAASDPGAVVDAHGRVHGVAGLRVVDPSVLPDPPRRGPACSAVALGELLGVVDPAG